MFNSHSFTYDVQEVTQDNLKFYLSFILKSLASKVNEPLRFKSQERVGKIVTKGEKF